MSRMDPPESPTATKNKPQHGLGFGKEKTSDRWLGCGFSRVDVLIGLLIGLLGFALAVHVRTAEILNGLAEILGVRTTHLVLQVVKREVQILGYMHCRDALAQILKARACSFEIAPRHRNAALCQRIGQRSIQLAVLQHGAWRL